ncbi:MAG: hypothetical protein AAFX99_06280 [Myxococcota bacterium]
MTARCPIPNANAAASWSREVTHTAALARRWFTATVALTEPLRRFQPWTLRSLSRLLPDMSGP